jgi:hypothetical protein
MGRSPAARCVAMWMLGGQFAALPRCGLSWGVSHVWLVDQYVRRLYTCEFGVYTATGRPLRVTADLSRRHRH